MAIRKSKRSEVMVSNGQLVGGGAGEYCQMLAHLTPIKQEQRTRAHNGHNSNAAVLAHFTDQFNQRERDRERRQRTIRMKKTCLNTGHTHSHTERQTPPPSIHQKH